MSVLMEFAMFPMDKGESVSAYVSRILQTIRGAGVPYQLTSMGTILETETLSEALEIVQKAYAVLAPDCHRVYATVKLDIRDDGRNRMEKKVTAVEESLEKRSKR